jgi:hypothetical protein
MIERKTKPGTVSTSAPPVPSYEVSDPQAAWERMGQLVERVVNAPHSASHNAARVSKSDPAPKP